MGAAKEHGSPLGYSVFQQILQGRGLDGAFETPQALTLSDIRSPGNLGQVQVFLKMFMDKTYHFLDTYIIRIRHGFAGIQDSFSRTTNSYPNGSPQNASKAAVNTAAGFPALKSPAR